jgi:hypothetical protein
MARFVLGVSLILFLVSLASAQNPPQSDPQTISLAAQAMAALTNGIAVSDVTLSGNATLIAGSDNETGSLTLQAKGTSESRIDLNLRGETRTEIRNNSGNSPQAEAVAPDGTTQWAQHNCRTEASRFFLGAFRASCFRVRQRFPNWSQNLLPV